MRTRAAEYEAVTRELRQRMDELVEAAGLIGRSAPRVMPAQGALRRAIDEALGVMVQQCLRAARDLDMVVLTCTVRAMVCREYEADRAAFERQHDRWSAADPLTRGRPPIPPRVPAAYVQA